MSKEIYKRFDEKSWQWDKNPRYSEMYLKSIICRYNDVYQTGEPVFLREIYEAFGWPITKESCTMGWLKSMEGSIDRIGIWYVQCKDNPTHFSVGMTVYDILDYLPSEEG